MTEIQLQIKDEISKCLQLLGAPVNLISIITSWGETLEDDEVLNFLKLYNSGGKPDIISKSSFN
jgi:hypothetical protein